MPKSINSEYKSNKEASARVAEATRGGIFSSIKAKLNDFLLLIKFRLTFTVIISSVLAFLIANEAGFQLLPLLILALGGFFVTAAANALNQVLEKDFDPLMSRTENRPVAAGRMNVSTAIFSAGVMSLAGISLLAYFNPWTAFLGTMALVMYAFVYTPLKRISPLAIPLGAIPGALPLLIGSAAAEGDLSYLGWSLFMIQFIWQFPHFWSIGLLGFDDYKKAGFKFLPVDNKEQLHRQIGIQSILFTIILIPFSFAPYYFGATGLISGIIVAFCSVGFVYFAYNFYKHFNRKSALRLMFYSIIYIQTILLAFVLDKV